MLKDMNKYLKPIEETFVDAEASESELSELLDMRAEKLLHKIICCDIGSGIGIREAKRYIKRELKKQDRDTRHACAESVIKGSFWSDKADCDVVRSDYAHNACMNVRAI